MSTHMAGDGSKRKRMWAGHRKKQELRIVERVRPGRGPIDRRSNPVQTLEPREQIFATFSGPMHA